MNKNTDNTLTLTNDQVIEIVNALLEYECVPSKDRVKEVVEHNDGVLSLRVLAPLLDRWLDCCAPLATKDGAQRLVADLAEYGLAQVASPWTAAWEYPGYLALHREGYPSVFATPDYHERGQISIEVTLYDTGHTAPRDNIAWPLAGRSAASFLEALAPLLDSIKPLTPAPKDAQIVPNNNLRSRSNP